LILRVELGYFAYWTFWENPVWPESLPQFLSVRGGLWLVSCLGLGTTSGNGSSFRYSPQASPREEG